MRMLVLIAGFILGVPPALGADDEIPDVRDASAPLPMKDAKNLIARGELVVDARVDAVDRVLRRQREAQLARAGAGAGRRRLRPDVQELP